LGCATHTPIYEGSHHVQLAYMAFNDNLTPPSLMAMNAAWQGLSSEVARVDSRREMRLLYPFFFPFISLGFMLIC